MFPPIFYSSIFCSWVFRFFSVSFRQNLVHVQLQIILKSTFWDLLDVRNPSCVRLAVTTQCSCQMNLHFGYTTVRWKCDFSNALMDFLMWTENVLSLSSSIFVYKQSLPERWEKYFKNSQSTVVCDVRLVENGLKHAKTSVVLLRVEYRFCLPIVIFMAS